jgi:hypothetical protein
MLLIKTDKAVAELASRQRNLGLKERALLLLADGRKPARELLSLLNTEAEVLETLLNNGYLTHAAPAAPAARDRSGAARPPDKPAAPPQAVDTFDGKRSLASARMFLFDISERMFARRDPAIAADFRERLRQARDRETMMTVTQDLLHHIDAVAGPERADSVSERLSMLLPDEALAA